MKQKGRERALQGLINKMKGMQGEVFFDAKSRDLGVPGHPVLYQGQCIKLDSVDLTDGM